MTDESKTTPNTNAALDLAAERATWDALAALHKVPAHQWWGTFKRVLAENGHEVRPHGK